MAEMINTRADIRGKSMAMNARLQTAVSCVQIRSANATEASISAGTRGGKMHGRSNSRIAPKVEPETSVIAMAFPK
jgi:hypothetical protein